MPPVLRGHLPSQHGFLNQPQSRSHTAGLLLITATRAGNAARTIASMLLPRPETRMTSDFMPLF